jgi:hypothetical protein
MAWVMLWAIVIMFAVTLVAFLCAVFNEHSGTFSKVILGLLDGTLGWCLKALIANLFESPYIKSQKSPKAHLDQ